MIRQAHTYLAGAVSGTALVAAAVVAFVLLVSFQALKDWPLAGISIGGGDSAATAPSAPGSGTPTSSRLGRLPRVWRPLAPPRPEVPLAAAMAAPPRSQGQPGRRSTLRRQPRPDRPPRKRLPPSPAGPEARRRPEWLLADRLGQLQPLTAAGGGGGGSTPGAGAGAGGSAGSGQSTSGAVTDTVNKTVSGVDEATGGVLGSTGVTEVTEKVVEGAAGPESPVGKTVDEVVKTVGGLLGGNK